MSATQRGRLLRYAGDANSRIILDAVGEATLEQASRIWRRWSCFCHTELGALHPCLHDASAAETEFALRAFFSRYRHSRFNPDGSLRGWRPIPMVSTTITSAASALASEFRHRSFRSPLHEPDSNRFLPSLKRLFKAFENLSPPPNRQKAITPKLLRSLRSYQQPGLRNHPDDHAIDLIIGAFFFAMRACEYVKTPKPGKTALLKLRSLNFRDRNKSLVPLTDPKLAAHSFFVTITFEDQKNGVRHERRTHQRSGDPFLCPVLRFARAICRIHHFQRACSPDTPLCSSTSPLFPGLLDSNYTLKLLRDTCEAHGGQGQFGFNSPDIGNKSLRSGAAMALFLQHHSSTHIMILGRWKSDAFLAYIRPQVLEWTNNMSPDMISFNDFIDLGITDRHQTAALQNGLSSNITEIPKFNLDF